MRRSDQIRSADGLPPSADATSVVDVYVDDEVQNDSRPVSSSTSRRVRTAAGGSPSGAGSIASCGDASHRNVRRHPRRHWSARSAVPSRPAGRHRAALRPGRPQGARRERDDRPGRRHLADRPRARLWGVDRRRGDPPRGRADVCVRRGRRLGYEKASACRRCLRGVTGDRRTGRVLV